MPAIGSIQHVALQMEAEKELGNPKALNTQIVAMAHPDATAAILSKREITCHLTSPPFQYEQIRDPGIRKLMDSYQAGGRGVVGLGRGRSGGSGAGASPRWARIARTTPGCCTVAMRRRRPPQRGQANTSSAHARCISAAQVQERGGRWPPALRGPASPWPASESPATVRP